MNDTQQPQQTIEAQFTIAGMIPAERGIYAVYNRADGTRWQTPVIAWGAWMLRQTTRDRFGTPKVEMLQQSGPLVYAAEVGMCPAAFVTGLPSLQGKNYRYLGVVPENGAHDPLWSPGTLGWNPAEKPIVAAD